MRTLPPRYGLTLALLPGCVLLSEFAPFLLRAKTGQWSVLPALVAYLWLLGALWWYALAELRAAMGSGAFQALTNQRQDAAATGVTDAAHLTLLGAWMALTLGLHPVGAILLTEGVSRLGLAWFNLYLTWASLYDGIYYGLSLALWLALYAALRRLPVRFDLNLRWNWKLWDAPILLGIAGVTYFAMTLYLRTLGGEHPPMHIFGISKDNVGASVFLAIGALFCVVNALCEELWFRGMLLTALRRLLPPAAAILLQGLCFGLSHWFGTPHGVLGLVLAGAWGCALGWWAWSRGSLWQAFAVHLVADWLIFAYTNK